MRSLVEMREMVLTANVVMVFVTKLLFGSAEDLEIVFHDTRQGEFSRSLSNYEIVTPVRVNENGEHLSHLLSHRLTPADRSRRHRRRRSSFGDLDGNAVHYGVKVDGTELLLELFSNDRLFGPGLVVERRRQKKRRRRSSGGSDDVTAWHGDARAERIAHNGCHFAGKVKGRPGSMVALATCEGLHGYIHTGQRDYFIEPIKNHNRSSSVGHPHLIYRSSALPPQLKPLPTRHPHTATDNSCGVTADDERERDLRTERATKTKAKRRRRRSVSLERNVETLVVVDRSMMEYHRYDNIENYVLTIMNMVSTIFHDATINNAVNIVLVRIIYLEQDEKELRIQTHADNTLASFCKWQSSINQMDDKHPNHHDVAILLTRYYVLRWLSHGGHGRKEAPSLAWVGPGICAKSLRNIGGSRRCEELLGDISFCSSKTLLPGNVDVFPLFRKALATPLTCSSTFDFPGSGKVCSRLVKFKNYVVGIVRPINVATKEYEGCCFPAFYLS